MDTWFDSSDNSPCIISPNDYLFGRQNKQDSPIKPAERFILFETNAGIPYVTKKYPSIKKYSFTLPGFLTNRVIYLLEGGNEVSLLQGDFGAPAAACSLEMAIALGCKILFVFGLCGGVGKNLEVGDLVLPTKILREEGTSFHYISGNKNILPDNYLSECLIEFLKRRNVSFFTGTTVTTDAVFRQTRKKELHWRENGIIGVDMESSALLSVANYYRIPAVCMLVVSDKHDLENGTQWRWGGNDFKKKQKKGIDLLIEFARSDFL